MKKIVLSVLLLLVTSINLSAYETDKYQKACDGGDAGGCFNLGVSYAKGLGMKQDYFKAKELFGKACDGGYAGGCYNYAILNKR